MKTPKEALKGMCDLSKVKYDDFRMWVGLKGEVEHALNELEILKSYPTVDEVCEALSEELNQVVTLYDNRFTGNDETICYTWKFPNGHINLVFDYEILPPHLITLIGRFYEGLGKGEGK